MKKKEVKITYRGWAGHFICAESCLFRLNTLLEYGDIRIVVSTVGRMRDRHHPDKKKIHYDTIGHNRHFETMAFHASKEGEFWDANVSRQINFDSPWALSDVNQENEANEMHAKVIKELISKLKKGEKFLTEE